MVPLPDWVRHAIAWQVYPLGFLDAAHDEPPSTAPVEHRLAGLGPWLDYLIDIGANTLLLGPVFASATHGYDTIDHYRVDPRLGDDADLTALVDAAHRRGIRVLLDGVFNHVGRDFPRFREALAQGPESAAAQWFHLFWREGAEPEWEHFEGHRDLVTLNHAEPAVIDYVTDVMCHWLDRGADGWRLDAAYAVPPAFWAAVLPRVRERHPDVYVVAEVIHGDYASFVSASTVDSVTQYELWKAIWSSLNDRNLFELAWSLGRHDDLLDSFVPLTFVGNHDVTRIASRLADPTLLPHALVVLFTVAGTPCVYAGDEQGFQGVKEDRPGGDDAVRPAFPASPDGLSALGAPILALHRELIGLRRRQPWLHDARTTVGHLANEQLAYVTRSADRSVHVALNLSAEPAVIPVPGAGQLLAGAGRRDGTGTGTTVTLPAAGWCVLDGADEPPSG